MDLMDKIHHQCYLFLANVHKNLVCRLDSYHLTRPTTTKTNINALYSSHDPKHSTHVYKTRAVHRDWTSALYVLARARARTLAPCSKWPHSSWLEVKLTECNVSLVASLTTNHMVRVWEDCWPMQKDSPAFSMKLSGGHYSRSFLTNLQLSQRMVFELCCTTGESPEHL